MFNEGISYESDVLNAAVNRGVVKKAGASFSFEGEKSGRRLRQCAPEIEGG